MAGGGEGTVEENLTRALDGAIEAGHDLTPAMAEIAGMLARAMQFNFLDQRTPLGVPWQKSRRVLDHGGETLRLSGDLFGAIREDWGREHAAAGPEASGGAAIYAAIHNFGFDGPVVVPFFTRTVESRFGVDLPEPTVEYVSSHIRHMKMPAREYAGWNDEMRADALDIIAVRVATLMGVGGAA